MLTAKQEKFVQSLVKGKSQYGAYKSAYDTKTMKRETIDNSAYKLMQKPEIKARYEELIGKAAQKAELKAENIIKELMSIAFTDRTNLTRVVSKTIKEGDKEITYQDVELTDTDELDDDTKKVIAGYKRTKDGIVVETYNKQDALELLGKYLGMFKDAAPIINNNISPYGNLTEEELRKLAGE